MSPTQVETTLSPPRLSRSAGGRVQRLGRLLRAIACLVAVTACTGAVIWPLLPAPTRRGAADWVRSHAGLLSSRAYYAVSHRGWRSVQLGNWEVLLPPAGGVLHDHRGEPQVAWPHMEQGLWLSQAADEALAKLPAASGLSEAQIGQAGELPRLILYASQRQLAAIWRWPEAHATTGIYWGGSVGVVAPVTWLPVMHPEHPGLAALGTQGSSVLQSTLVHELTHWAHDRVSLGRMPRWLSEGIAVRAEERTFGHEAPAELIAARAIRAGQASIAEFAMWFGATDASRSQELQAYALARSVVCYLDHSALDGWDERILARLAAGDRFEQAFVAASGMTLAEVEKQWLRWLDVSAKPQ